MEFKELIKERYSCRNLTGDPIDEAKINEILEMANLAPTAVNYQPVKIWVMRSAKAVENVKKVTNFTFGANTFLVVGGKKSAAWIRSFDEQTFETVDASIVATYVMLAIHNCGLRSTWVGKFDAAMLKELYPEMDGYNLIAIFPLGNPTDDAKPSARHEQRKGIDEISKEL